MGSGPNRQRNHRGFKTDARGVGPRGYLTSFEFSVCQLGFQKKKFVSMAMDFLINLVKNLLLIFFAFYTCACAKKLHKDLRTITI